jgi:hypothetical protein
LRPVSTSFSTAIHQRRQQTRCSYHSALELALQNKSMRVATTQVTRIKLRNASGYLR